MRIILSPAKKMKQDDNGGISAAALPVFLGEAEQIRDWLGTKSAAELKKLWVCNDNIVRQNMERLSSMNLTGSLTPAILAFDGIAYQYMAPAVFETRMLDYIQEHLRILSGFYGVLRPLDGVTPYRLEMQAKAGIGGKKDLYDFWGSRLYENVLDDSRIIINLASKEYSRCIEKYLRLGDTCITCVFAELENGKPVQKGVYCKMARGDMVRFMAEGNITDPARLREYHRMGYHFEEASSSDSTYVFLREKNAPGGPEEEG